MMIETSKFSEIYNRHRSPNYINTKYFLLIKKVLTIISIYVKEDE